MKESGFTYDLADQEHVDDLAQSIFWHLNFLISDIPSDLDAETIKLAIESHVSDLAMEASE